VKRWLLWVPLLAFAVLLAVFVNGLVKPADRTVRSALIGKKLPAFALPAIAPGKPGLTTADFAAGERRLLNVFASWCVPCIVEAPKLMALKRAGVAIDGIAIRDADADVRTFLARNGDPYARIGSDRESRVQLALGSSGVPESFVIDGQGRIVLQHIGTIEEADIPTIIAAVRNGK
jgi:cytochrome c biogenesis protein CcmG/thiol:disulfide interchange protein DsbE